MSTLYGCIVARITRVLSPAHKIEKEVLESRQEPTWEREDLSEHAQKTHPYLASHSTGSHQQHTSPGPDFSDVPSFSCAQVDQTHLAS